MHSSTSSFERVIPDQPWRGMAVLVVMIILVAAAAWEIRVRSVGYAPTLNDTDDLWAQTRRRVEPGSIAIVGDSRAWFDLDLDELQRGLGSRPVQLALPGSCAYPVLEDLANDESFHGTIICSVVPRMFFAPASTPPFARAQKSVKRYHTQTLAQRLSHRLAIPLEEHIAFLKETDLTLDALLDQVPIPNRPGALIPPPGPPYFETVDRERRARMAESCAHAGRLQTRVSEGWIPLFTPPPPPTYIPLEVFGARMNAAIEERFQNTAVAVKKFRARGGKIIFVRFPLSGKLKELEDKITPRAGIWERLLKETSVPGIYFEDYPELSTFQCPEWSHLSAEDSVEFTRRLVPHLRSALGM